MVAEQSLLEILERHGIIDHRAGWRAHIAPGGLNSRVYVVTDSSSRPRWTVRVANPGQERLLEHEARALDELARSGCRCAPAGARLIAGTAVPNGRLLVHRWAAGSSAPLSTRGAAALAALAACLAAIHSRRRERFTLWPDMQPRTGTLGDLYRARVASLDRHAPIAGLEARVAGRLAALHGRPLDRRDGWDSREFALIHGDLSEGNIIWDTDNVTLIDWEYARAADPAEELAYLLAEQPLPPDRETAFMAAYFAAGGDRGVTARIAAWNAFVRLDSALWWADYLRDRGLDPATDARVVDRI